MSPTRAAWAGAAVGYGLIAVLGWTMWTDTTPAPQRVGDVIVLTALVGTPLAAAAAILAHRLAMAARGDDIAERIVGMASAGIDEPGDEWSAAMQAELASITDRRQRRRFAVGCVVASLRTSTGKAVWLPAVAGGAVVAAATLVASRVSLGGGRSGILGMTLLPTVLVIFGAAFFTAATTNPVVLARAHHRCALPGRHARRLADGVDAGSRPLVPRRRPGIHHGRRRTLGLPPRPGRCGLGPPRVRGTSPRAVVALARARRRRRRPNDPPEAGTGHLTRLIDGLAATTRGARPSRG